MSLALRYAPSHELPSALTDPTVHQQMLAQSSAILRYVAAVGGLHPTDPLAAAHVDALVAEEEDMFAGLSVSRYGESTRAHVVP